MPPLVPVVIRTRDGLLSITGVPPNQGFYLYKMLSVDKIDETAGQQVTSAFDKERCRTYKLVGQIPIYEEQS